MVVTERNVKDEIAELRREIGKGKLDDKSASELAEMRKKISELEARLDAKKPLFEKAGKKSEDSDEDEEDDDGWDF